MFYFAANVLVMCPQTATVMCSGMHVITQDDMDSGEVSNTGTVSCLSSAGEPVMEEEGDTTVLPGTPIVSLGQCRIPATCWGDLESGATVFFFFFIVTLNRQTILRAARGLKGPSHLSPRIGFIQPCRS